LIRASFGLEAELTLLRQMAMRLGQVAQGDAVLARTGEHTFVIAALAASEEALATLARGVLAVLDEPFENWGEALHLDPCVGVALYPNDGADHDSLAQSAEAAVQRALTMMTERYTFYHPELNDGVHERFRLESGLRRALERGEFAVHYQPQASLSSGAIVGLEALVRWQHPELGLIGPAAFIELAEETGLILPIGEWVLHTACAQNAAWQCAGMRAVPVSVNLSARQFSPGIVDTVSRVLAETGLDPQLLELELTESASMEDPEKTCEIMGQLKAMGVRLAIDDFGTGYSNLNYLKRFPVDRLKLDRSFVRDILSDPDDLAISRAVIAMAHGLRLNVVAEGVEDRGQLALLAENGCDDIQGYLFSRPVGADDCGQMLREQRSLALPS
jgi:EAL domain-containing protein (putative c-di-GMP-specific phosphodiesterase class I)